MKFAYADPPYVGQAKRLYGKHRDYGGEVDHRALIQRLVDDYPDGWALSLSCKSLQLVLGLCPPGVRVLAWVKRLHGFLAGTRIQWCWEPVILCGGRQGKHVAGDHTLRDWIEAHPPGSLHTFRPLEPGHVIGRKPDEFCYWVFDCLGARAPEDELHDLFPGTGAVGQCWERWHSQPLLRRMDSCNTAGSENG